MTRILSATCSLVLMAGLAPAASAQLAVRAERVMTMAGPPIEDGIVVLRDGKIAQIGTAAAVDVPDGFPLLTAAVVTPGLIDGRSTVGLSGILNIPHDQDQLERSSPIQPELRAIDAYNAREDLIEWLRGFGITTLHTGHAPGELVSGQMMVVKTWGRTVEAATLKAPSAVTATLGQAAQKKDDKSPGTRGKMVAMLRAEFIKAREYQAKIERSRLEEDEDGEAVARDLRLETLAAVLAGDLPLMVTAQRGQDIANALRLAEEFGFRLWLDGAAESYLLLQELKAAEVVVFIHPTMARPAGDLENASFETASKLIAAGIPTLFQSGFEPYVPKTRVVLWEAAQAAANGVPRQQALAAITSQAARVLGVDDRVGSLVVGKDGDLALFDGDPFEYTSHCVGVIIDGQIVSDVRR